MMRSKRSRSSGAARSGCAALFVHAALGVACADAGNDSLVRRTPYADPPRASPAAPNGDDAGSLDARAPAPTGPLAVATAPAAVTPGPNTIDLASAGAPGATVTFDATIQGSSLTLANLVIAAPATQAVTVARPVLGLVHVNGAVTQDWSVAAFSETIGAGQRAVVASMVAESKWVPTWRLSIGFGQLAGAGEVVDAGSGEASPSRDGSTGAPGCKSVAVFAQKAAPELQACLACHAGGGRGVASFDLSPLATNDAADACAHARTQVNLANPGESGIILAPTGVVAGHPFTSPDPNYAADLEAWITSEE
jgi:hypothetical protein